MLRKVFAIVAAVLVWCGVVLGLGTFFNSVFGNPSTNSGFFSVLRIFVLLVSFTIASVVYYLIKGEEPEPEIKEKQRITSKEISKKLAEKRNKHHKENSH